MVHPLCSKMLFVILFTYFRFSFFYPILVTILINLVTLMSNNEVFFYEFFYLIVLKYTGRE